MKISDLEVADCIYADENRLSNEIRNLNYPQKYILLELGNELFSLEIISVTKTAFYLKIDDQDNILIEWNKYVSDLEEEIRLLKEEIKKYQR